MYNLWGPDFQFGVAENLSVGVMTSWLAVPVIVTAKISIPVVRDRMNIGTGALLGTILGEDIRFEDKILV